MSLGATNKQPAARPSKTEDTEFDLFDALRFLVAWRHLIALGALLGLLGACGYLLLADRLYSSQLSFFPISPEDKSSMGRAMLEMLPLAQTTQTQRTSTFILTILESRQLSERVIEKLGLLPELFPERWDGKRQSWKERTWYGATLKPPTPTAGASRLLRDALKIEDKEGLMSVEILWPRPERCPELAEEYLRQLQAFLLQGELTTIKRQRRFIERRLESLSREIKEIEETLIIFSEGSTSIEISEASLDLISRSSQLLADLSGIAIELKVLQGLYGAKQDHAGLAAYEQRIEALRAELAEQGGKLDDVTGTERKIIVPLTKVPLLSLEYQRQKQDLQLLRNLFISLRNELALAQINEAKEEVTFQVLDPPLPGAQVTPVPLRDLVLGLLFGLVFGLATTLTLRFLAEFLDRPWCRAEFWQSTLTLRRRN